MQSIRSSDKTTNATIEPAQSPRGQGAATFKHWLVLAVVAAIPALFWTGVIAFTAWFWGALVSALTLSSIAVSVAAAVVLIMAAMTVAKGADQHSGSRTAHEFKSDAASRLEERLVLVGLDPLHLSAVEPAAYQQMRQICGTCAKVDQCDRDLEKGDWNAGQTGYCPNALAIDKLIVAPM